MPKSRSLHGRPFAAGLLGGLALLTVTIGAGTPETGALRQSPPKKQPHFTQPLLTPQQWALLDSAVDRGVDFIAKKQEPDGSFPTLVSGQPGVTSLCVMALLARGHQPGKGRYGAVIERGVDYVLSMQDADTGAIMPERTAAGLNVAGHYNHGISGVMLAEVYGMTDAKRHERIRTAVVKALAYTRRQQLRPKKIPEEIGGWRYLNNAPLGDADLSVTAWQLMFLRSARNAEFDVPEEWVKQAMRFVHRTFDAEQRAFVYGLIGTKRYCSRGTVGAGIVCLALAGEHESETAKVAGDWILRSSFEPYNEISFRDDRYHYGAFYCSHAMFQLGGDYWQRFFHKLLKTLSDAQHADGSWDTERAARDGEFGNLYTSALAVLALATPYQILPVYQR